MFELKDPELITLLKPIALVAKIVAPILIGSLIIGTIRILFSIHEWCEARQLERINKCMCGERGNETWAFIDELLLPWIFNIICVGVVALGIVFWMGVFGKKGWA